MAFQYLSVSAWSSVSIMKETDSFGLNSGPPFSPMNGTPSTVNATVSSAPAWPPGKSPGALIASPTWLSGNTLA